MNMRIVNKSGIDFLLEACRALENESEGREDAGVRIIGSVGVVGFQGNGGDSVIKRVGTEGDHGERAEKEIEINRLIREEDRGTQETLFDTRGIDATAVAPTITASRSSSVLGNMNGNGHSFVRESTSHDVETVTTPLSESRPDIGHTTSNAEASLKGIKASLDIHCKEFSFAIPPAPSQSSGGSSIRTPGLCTASPQGLGESLRGSHEPCLTYAAEFSSFHGFFVKPAHLPLLESYFQRVGLFWDENRWGSRSTLNFFISMLGQVLELLSRPWHQLSRENMNYISHCFIDLEDAKFCLDSLSEQRRMVTTILENYEWREKRRLALEKELRLSLESKRLISEALEIVNNRIQTMRNKLSEIDKDLPPELLNFDFKSCGFSLSPSQA